MKERPIIFSGEMIKAILDGRKTQTRRIIKNQPGPRTVAYTELLPGHFKPVRSLRDFTGDIGGKDHKKALNEFWANEKNETLYFPYGQPGDRLWVRETWAIGIMLAGGFSYKASNHRPADGEKWRPSIHMPRAASRITLEITGVRVERVQDINAVRHDDVLAEGWPFGEKAQDENPVNDFRRLWDSLNKKRGYGWDTNCYVWVIEFKRVEKGGFHEIP